jgi:hypothetical protein
VDGEVSPRLFAQRVAASLLGVVGGIAVTLATIGLYSVMSYAVSQRTQEMGIRWRWARSQVKLSRWC